MSKIVFIFEVLVSLLYDPLHHLLSGEVAVNVDQDNIFLVILNLVRETNNILQTRRLIL